MAAALPGASPPGPHVPPGLTAHLAIGPVRLLGVPVTALARLNPGEHERRREIGLGPVTDPALLDRLLNLPAGLPVADPAAWAQALALPAGIVSRARDGRTVTRTLDFPLTVDAVVVPARRRGCCGRSRTPACSRPSPSAGPRGGTGPVYGPAGARSAASACSARTAPSSSRRNRRPACAWTAGPGCCGRRPTAAGCPGPAQPYNHGAAIPAGSASRCAARSAKKAGSVSAAQARRPSLTAATEAEHRPPNGSHTQSPGPVTAVRARSMKSSGFWFRCAALAAVGL